MKQTKEEDLRRRSENKTLLVVEQILGKIETLLRQTEALDSQAIRQLTAAVKDLKDIQQKETREDRDAGGIKVVLEGELEAYGK